MTERHVAKVDARTRAEKVETFRELLGWQLDAEIGRRAGVPADFVRAYREKLAIPSLAERRAGVTPAVAPRPAPAPAPTPPPVAMVATPRERKAPGGIASALDAHLALFGQHSDAAIAEIAGMSRGAVYQYRHRRNIPAYAGPAAPAPVAVAAPVAVRVVAPVAAAAPVAVRVAAPVAAVAPVVAVAPPVAPPVAVAAPVRAPGPPSPSLAYLVVVRRDEKDEPYIVVGRDVADASALAMRAARGEIVSVRRYLPALA